MNSLTPEQIELVAKHNARSFLRILSLMAMLKDDLSMSVDFNKMHRPKGKPRTQQEETYAAVLETQQKIAACYNRLLTCSGWRARHLSNELNSERIKDLHSLIDILLDIENIEEVGQLLLRSQTLPEPSSEEKPEPEQNNNASDVEVV